MKKYVIFCSFRVLPSYLNRGILQQAYCSSSRTRNPYDVLGLKTTCSTRDVKKAYIKLCKELHPDMKPGDTSQHKKFIELNNAYTAILNSGNKRFNVKREAPTNDNTFWKSPPYTDDSQNFHKSEKPWYEREEYQQYYQHNQEYTVNKDNRISNLQVLGGCFILVVIGSVLYITAYWFGLKYKEETTDKKSRKISESYHDLRKDILNKDKMERLDDLKKKWSQ